MLELVRKLPYDHPYRWDGTEVGGVRLWRPSDLGSTLVLWLDAEDTDSVVLRTGTNFVESWNDKSGNNNHVSNDTAATQPPYLPTDWNGKPTVSFTEIGQEFLFKSGVLNFKSNEDFTLAGAFEFRQTNRQWDMIAGWRTTPNSSGSAGGVPILQGMSTAQEIGYHNTDQVDVRIAVAVTTRLGKKIATISRSGGTNGNGGAATVTCTGFSQPTYITNGTQTWVSASTTGFQIGGRQQSATQYGNKYISEVVGCNTKLSTEDREKLEGYLAWKWGVEGDLPAAHPYKQSPPVIPAVAPTVTSPTVTDITTNSATLGGNVTEDGGDPITERGVVLSLTSVNSNPEIGGTGVTKLSTSGTTGVFTVPVSSLSDDSAYSFKAYATNNAGTGYSPVATFATLEEPPAGDIRELLFGVQPRSESISGHKIWCWDDPYGLASTHPDIHEMGYLIINDTATTRWKNTLPSLEGSGVTTETRSVNTGPLNVTIPTKEAQDIALQIIGKGYGPGEVAITLNKYGSPTSSGAPHIGLIFRSILDAPQDWFTSHSGTWYVPGEVCTPAVVTDINEGSIPTVTNAPVNTDNRDSLFTANGVAYWSGWMNEFCTEWKRLQREDPAFATLPDITGFWLDTEDLMQVSNVLRQWSRMLNDPRADDRAAMPGMSMTMRQIHLAVRDSLDPADRLPETNGVVDDTSGLGPAAWSTTYRAWSEAVGPYVHLVEAAAMRTVADNEIRPFFPGAWIGNWYTSSDHFFSTRFPNSPSVPPIEYYRRSGHGTHSSTVFYERPLEDLDKVLNSESLKPLAPWLFHPARWGEQGNNTAADVDFWELGGNWNLPVDLQTKYAAEIAAAAGNIEATNLVLAEIYWNEVVPRLVDAGCRHFLLWWNPGAVAGIDTTAAGNIVKAAYDDYMSSIPSTPLAKYIHPSLGLMASAVPKSILKNGIKSWTLIKSSEGDGVILRINHKHFVGKYVYPEHALQVIVALHLRLGASAGTEEQQRTLKKLIDAKYVTEV